MKEILLYIIYIVVILLVGTFAINQVLEFRYRSVFLQAPCEVCARLNEHLRTCFDDASTYIIERTPSFNWSEFNFTASSASQEE